LLLRVGQFEIQAAETDEGIELANLLLIDDSLKGIFVITYLLVDEF